jgi:hypothetical protein
MQVLCRPKNFGRHCLSIKKKNCNPYFIVIMITVLIMNLIFLGGQFQNSKLFCHFYYTERLPQVIYVRLL